MFVAFFLVGLIASAAAVPVEELNERNKVRPLKPLLQGENIGQDTKEHKPIFSNENHFNQQEQNSFLELDERESNIGKDGDLEGDSKEIATTDEKQKEFLKKFFKNPKLFDGNTIKEEEPQTNPVNDRDVQTEVRNADVIDEHASQIENDVLPTTEDHLPLDEQEDSTEESNPENMDSVQLYEYFQSVNVDNNEQSNPSKDSQLSIDISDANCRDNICKTDGATDVETIKDKINEILPNEDKRPLGTDDPINEEELLQTPSDSIESLDTNKNKNAVSNPEDSNYDDKLEEDIDDKKIRGSNEEDQTTSASQDSITLGSKDDDAEGIEVNEDVDVESSKTQNLEGPSTIEYENKDIEMNEELRALENTGNIDLESAEKQEELNQNEHQTNKKVKENSESDNQNGLVSIVGKTSDLDKTLQNSRENDKDMDTDTTDAKNLEAIDEDDNLRVILPLENSKDHVIFEQDKDGEDSDEAPEDSNSSSVKDTSANVPPKQRSSTKEKHDDVPVAIQTNSIAEQDLAQLEEHIPQEKFQEDESHDVKDSKEEPEESKLASAKETSSTVLPKQHSSDKEKHDVTVATQTNSIAEQEAGQLDEHNSQAKSEEDKSHDVKETADLNQSNIVSVTEQHQIEPQISEESTNIEEEKDLTTKTLEQLQNVEGAKEEPDFSILKVPETKGSNKNKNNDLTDVKDHQDEQGADDYDDEEDFNEDKLDIEGTVSSEIYNTPEKDYTNSDIEIVTLFGVEYGFPCKSRENQKKPEVQKNPKKNHLSRTDQIIPQELPLLVETETESTTLPSNIDINMKAIAVPDDLTINNEETEFPMILKVSEISEKNQHVILDQSESNNEKYPVKEEKKDSEVLDSHVIDTKSINNVQDTQKEDKTTENKGTALADEDRTPTTSETLGETSFETEDARMKPQNKEAEYEDHLNNIDSVVPEDLPRSIEEDEIPRTLQNVELVEENRNTIVQKDARNKKQFLEGEDQRDTNLKHHLENEDADDWEDSDTNSIEDKQENDNIGSFYDEKCDEKKDGVYMVPDNCHEILYCTNKISTIHECRNGLVFDEVSTEGYPMCRSVERAQRQDCKVAESPSKQDKLEEKNDEELEKWEAGVQPWMDNLNCIGRETGIYEVPDHCGFFITCFSGINFGATSCPVGTVFGKDRHTGEKGCWFAEDVKREGCAQTDFCKRMGPGMHLNHKRSCNRYILCTSQESAAFDVPCPPHTVFDQGQVSCIHWATSKREECK